MSALAWRLHAFASRAPHRPGHAPALIATQSPTRRSPG